MNPLASYPRTADLAFWINEREAMRHRREAYMAPPWSADPDMAEVRYCNVHREDDKITRYIRSSGTYSGPSVPVWTVVLARMVNRVTTLARLAPAVGRADLEEIKRILKELRVTDRIWGNAYTISTCGKSMDKVDYVIDHVVLAFMQAGEPEFDTLAACFENMTNVNGFGSFLAAQVVADLKNTPGHPLQQAADWFTWCAPGPGSLKGLAAFYGRASTPGTFDIDIAACYTLTVPLVVDKNIHMQDFQNCLCEFSKYIRVREGGRARNNYVARHPS